jgi:hypothetical protein
MDVRTITDARLFEVNPVKWPAYLGTSLTVEMRGRYSDDSHHYDSYYRYDKTLTGPVDYAQTMLLSLTSWMTNSLEYLRDQPDSTLSDFARNHVDQVAAQITELTAWLKENGSQAPEETEMAIRSFEEFRKECRQSAPTEENSVSHWERRLAFMSKTPAV